MLRLVDVGALKSIVKKHFLKEEGIIKIVKENVGCK